MQFLRPFIFLTLSCALLPGAAVAQLKLPNAAPAPSAPARPVQAPAEKPAPSADVAEKVAAGKLAAAGWLTLLDRKDWGTAWESSAGMFRKNVPLASWMDAIPKVRAPLGAMVERAPAEAQHRSALEGSPPGDYVSVIFLTRFEKQEVQEVVTTAREADGKWRVTGYSTR